ncbi:MAG: hypothetical protein J0L73_04185 [Verrucomicrobia bacterium]|nr:hypothetical protein [Verrucomicrobiota bacterium]
MNSASYCRIFASLALLLVSTLVVAQTDVSKTKNKLDALLKEFPGMFRDALHEYAKIRLRDETLMESRKEFEANNKITELKLDQISDDSPQVSFRLGNSTTPKTYWEFTLNVKDQRWVFSRAIASTDGFQLTLLDSDSGPFLRKAFAKLQSNEIAK